jgi:CubicO group peptidase (beta-lactamase class C family)
MRHGFGLLLLASAMIAPNAIAAQTAPRSVAAAPADNAALAQVVDRVAADLIASHASAGFSVAIFEDGRPALVKGYGTANFEDRTPVIAATVFRIGSITKEFTAASILLLAERGKLSVDDRLSQYLPDFPRAGEVTLRELLNHTSGIRNYTDETWLAETSVRNLTTAQMVDYIARQKPLYDFEPQTGWSYSNSGFFLLGAVIEKVSGQSYAQFLEENVLKPLALNDTRVDDFAEIVPHRAAGYVKAPGAPTGFANAAFISMSAAGAAGAIRSTAGDLARWHEALLGGKLLRPESLRTMLEPGKLKDGRLASAARPANPAAKPNGTSDYGFGITVSEREGRRSIGHGGSINGFNSSLQSYPDAKVTIAILTNTLPAAGAVSSAIVKAVLPSR